ncbi:MAG: LPS export ABC transporter permease LptG [Acidobacteriia bacterium]|nr:LPS export ABC transporter permease LptG [Terriglobia bacterium]
MRILTKYILREVLWHALIGAGVFTFVIFMRDVGRLMELVVRNSAPVPSVAEIFAFTLPTALTVTIPMGVLVGILIGLSRLAADSEVTAMRASGIGVSLFVRVIALFAIAAWMIALVNQVWVAPWSARKLADLQNRLKGSQASFEVQPRVFYENFENYVLYVQDVQAASGAAIWKGIFLADISTPSAPKITLAEEGVVVSESPNRLRLRLKNGSQHESVPRNPQQYSITTFSDTNIPITLPEPESGQKLQYGLRPIPELTSAELFHHSRSMFPEARRFLTIELQRRLALPTACLVLAMVGIPLGLSAKKGGKSAGFVLTILLVFLYYFASLGGVALARQGKLPPTLGAWLANLAFAVGGIFLLWRVDRMPIEIGSLRGLWARLLQRMQRRTDTAAGAFERAASRRRVFSAHFPQILDDYILRDFLTFVAMVLAMFLVLTIVFSFFELLGDIIRNRVPLVTVGEYLLNVLPSMVYLMMPMSVLIAVLVTFGLMQKSNEITAMKATGISIYRAALPVLVFAAVLPVGLFFFDQFYLPHANKRQDALWNQIKGRPAQTYLRPDRKWIFGQHSTIYYYELFDANANQFGGISAFEFDPRTFELTKRVYAREAHWGANIDKWIFEQGWTRSFHGPAIEEFRRFDARTFDEMDEPPTYFKKEVKQSSEMNYDELNRYIQDLQQSGFETVRLRVQLHKKFAFPIITFVMALLALPFALGLGRRGALTGVAMGIGIAIVYWVGASLFEALGNVNQLPPALAAWSPDVIFAMAGGYLLLKVPT